MQSCPKQLLPQELVGESARHLKAGSKHAAAHRVLVEVRRRLVHQALVVALRVVEDEEVEVEVVNGGPPDPSLPASGSFGGALDHTPLRVSQTATSVASA